MRFGASRTQHGAPPPARVEDSDRCSSRELGQHCATPTNTRPPSRRRRVNPVRDRLSKAKMGCQVSAHLPLSFSSSSYTRKTHVASWGSPQFRGSTGARGRHTRECVGDAAPTAERYYAAARTADHPAHGTARVGRAGDGAARVVCHCAGRAGHGKGMGQTRCDDRRNRPSRA